METWSKKNISSGSVLIAAMMAANVINFLFNAILGRVLSFEEFGLIIFINTVWSLFAIFLSAFGSSVNHRTAWLSAKIHEKAGAVFLKNIRRKTILTGIIAAALLLLASPMLAVFFKTPNLLPFVILSPIIILGITTSANKGYLQGKFHFKSVGVIVIIEAVTKLISALALLRLGLNEWVYLSIPISLTAAFAATLALVFGKVKTPKKRIEEETSEDLRSFPSKFYGASLLTGLSSAAFINLDIILVKHFLSPELAGQYAFLSLPGKMIYFLGSLFASFMITFVSHETGAGKNPNKTFKRFFGLVTLLVLGAFVFIGPLGYITVPILFGSKAADILPYLTPYALAITLYSLASTIVIYHLARKHYIFSFASILMSAAMSLGIILFHSGLADITNVMLASSFFNFLLMSLLHLLQKHGRFIFRNLTDFFDAFFPLPKLQKQSPDGKNILIFNWRDLKHKFAGGAETYIEELARRFVKAGHNVTLFCGNDGESPRNEMVKGVRIIRRGGFYFVYLWAFLYYLTKFRGRYDIIIDCQNGVPFFTPLYVKEEIYCVMHHVHQEIFYKYLPKPLAIFAAFLENTLMPWAYRDIKFITVSESTLKDMKKLRLGLSGTKIIFPGIDLKELKPGQKSETPSVLYLGRLKAYKSIDTLIRAFKKVSLAVPKAKLVIAGSGEEEGRLKKFAEHTGLKEKVKFLGKVTDEEKVRLLQSAWVFVNPSEMEGWGITTIEANACGVPVVASDVPGLRDSVKNPHTGFLVPQGKSDSFADKIILLMKDMELNREMQKDSVKWAKNFDWSKSSASFLKLITKKGLKI